MHWTLLATSRFLVFAQIRRKVTQNFRRQPASILLVQLDMNAYGENNTLLSSEVQVVICCCDRGEREQTRINSKLVKTEILSTEVLMNCCARLVELLCCVLSIGQKHDDVSCVTHLLAWHAMPEASTTPSGAYVAVVVGRSDCQLISSSKQS